MKCKCIEELEAGVQERGYDGKKVVKATMLSAAFVFNKGGMVYKTTSNIELEIEGLKKKKTLPITHNFCPFCGVEIEKEN